MRSGFVFAYISADTRAADFKFAAKVLLGSGRLNSKDCQCKVANFVMEGHLSAFKVW